MKVDSEYHTADKPKWARFSKWKPGRTFYAEHGANIGVGSTPQQAVLDLRREYTAWRTGGLYE